MSTKRGVIQRGTGNWRNVTTTRVRPQESGIAVEEGGMVVKTTQASADVALSAGATLAWEVIDNAHGKAIADALVGAAIESAKARGCKKVWDIDLAFCAGFPVTPEGAAEFRKKYGIRRPSIDWPTKPSETPDPAFSPTVIDLDTGKIA